MTDISHLITWWFYLFAIGFINLPLTVSIFNRHIDLGYGFSKTLGSIIVTYAIFLAATFKLAPFDRTSLLVSFTLLALVNLLFTVRNSNVLTRTVKKHVRVIAFQEILFSAGLVFWTLVRGYQPSIEGLEKFMDYGFINSILKSRNLPPIDMWFAGQSINYYWFGHLWTAVLTKLSQVPPSVAYNLMIATILGFGLTGAFSIAATLFKNIKKSSLKKAYVVGIISALLLNFGGNFQTAYHYFKNNSFANYWYPDATRFIGYTPETTDKTIHEFPIYSYVVSDLHAHLLNFPLVLLYVALIYALVHSKKTSKKRLTALGVLLGIMFMTNAWDFANYLLLTGFVFLLFNLKKKGLTPATFIKTTIEIIVLIVTAAVIVLPFILNFTSITQGVHLTHTKTPLWQLFVLWGMPAILTTIFVGVLAVKTKFKNLQSSDLFIIALLLSAWALITLPEFVYVKDIYIASHYRANTMFKLTYQAFVLFYLASGYLIARSLTLLKSRLTKLFLALVFGAILLPIVVYPYFAISSYYGKLTTYKGLNGEQWLAQENPDVYNVIAWLRKNEKGRITILEAPGDSYTKYDSISAYTGNPTVSGWFVHEWLWRGDASFPQARVDDIAEIYTSNDIQIVKQLLAKYAVDYVIVGDFEREKYSGLQETKFSQIARVAYSSNDTKVYKINN